MNPLTVNPAIVIANARATRDQGSPRRPDRSVRAGRVRRAVPPPQA